MTDKQLLERAARAYWGSEIDDVCSIRWLEEDQCIGYTHADNQDHNGIDLELLWNPLTHYGDALGLAVKLSIDVTFRFVGGQRCEALAPGGQLMVEPFDAPGCNGEATCRAIVRAAAAMAPEEAE